MALGLLLTLLMTAAVEVAPSVPGPASDDAKGNAPGVLILVCTALLCVFLVALCIKCSKSNINRARLQESNINRARLQESSINRARLQETLINRKPVPKKQQSAKERSLDAKRERENAERDVNYYLDVARTRTDPEKFDFSIECSLPDAGSRMQKYWFLAIPNGASSSQPVLITDAPLPQQCPLLEGGDQQGERLIKKKTVEAVNKLMRKLQEHPCIQPIKEIGSFGRKTYVLIRQPYMASGSLKDTIYGVRPDQDWADKYPDPPQLWEDTYKCVCCTKRKRSRHLIADEESAIAEDESDGTTSCFCCRMSSDNENESMNCCTRLMIKLCCFCCWCFTRSICCRKSRCCTRWAKDYLKACCCCKKVPPPKYGLPVSEVAKCGWQILKAMKYLYKQGFPVLGHVQSGNIFVDQDDVCRLGGYENTLLGYRSRFYRMCKDHLEHMDVIMFGHLVFEMSCGYELTTLEPTEEDYQAVRHIDRGEEVEEVLRFIFDLGVSTSASETPEELVTKIKKHNFFKSVPKLPQLESKKFVLSQFLKDLVPDFSKEKILNAVRQGQDDDGANEHASLKKKRAWIRHHKPQPDNVTSKEMADLSSSSAHGASYGTCSD